MNFKKNMFASLSTAALSVVFALGFLAEAKAQDKSADASGTWTWTVPGRQGRPDRKMTAKLKVDGDKVTGKITQPGRDGQEIENEIKDGKIKGDEISFSVTREFNGNSMTTKYNGKVSADAIKGKMEFERNGEPVKRDWEAKRGDAK
ncbi:MAG TPA: hypothetical protein VFE51_10340 [Verrucomicrobiae bacterium]|nr:hypothetical protein [Verrucomicrobiae bacterium]